LIFVKSSRKYPAVGDLTSEKSKWRRRKKNMSRMMWSPDELSRLVQAWRESLSASQKGGGKARMKRPTDLNQAVHERFEALDSEGATSRSAHAVKMKMATLRETYAFIRNFQENKEMSGGAEWFSLLQNHQKKLMKNAGSKRVQPVDEELFEALHDVIREEGAADEESEDEGEEETESDDASDGDKYQATVIQKKKRTAPKKARFSLPVVATSIGTGSKVAALEAEAGELVGHEEEGPKKPKRRRTTAPPSTMNVAEVLEHQSQVLAGFLEKRVEERTEERKFWAAETAKDRALLRELLTHK
jgi:hypothetical protein